MVRWINIRYMLFRCWCISILRVIGKISWYWCFIWINVFWLCFASTILCWCWYHIHWNVDWYDTHVSLVHLSRWRKIYWDTQQLTLPRLHIWNLGYYVVNASTEGTDLPRETAILVTSFVGSQILLRVKKQFANNQLQCVSLLSLSRAAMKKICL